MMNGPRPRKTGRNDPKAAIEEQKYWSYKKRNDDIRLRMINADELDSAILRPVLIETCFAIREILLDHYKLYMAHNFTLYCEL